jgi:hypothetical protein
MNKEIERLIQKEWNEELVEELNQLSKVADIVRRQRAKMGVTN